MHDKHEKSPSQTLGVMGHYRSKPRGEDFVGGFPVTPNTQKDQDYLAKADRVVHQYEHDQITGRPTH